ncbi:thiamine pyrophosphate-dependent enzyme [Haloprofundus salinisoli]|uniref:thiamine pyrophosphate-dependent enzyme n=1 Tax=Haloprofundus salinisoli TaxID=2876193 RepID=UPI001CCA28B3|nr:thiamine pyrophosphate-dependent enzyme [Haloprofundus salinisoli]
MVADQFACTAAVLEETPDAVVVSNLGVASYVLAEVQDRERNFYLWGSMGSTTATGIGVALGTDEQVTVLAGDGSLTMSLGVCSTVATAAPPNLTVVCFDNGIYGTTGGQPTPSIDFAAAAEAQGLPATSVADDAAFAEAYADAVARDGPSLIECMVEPSDPEARPTFDFPHIPRRVRDSLAE